MKTIGRWCGWCGVRGCEKPHSDRRGFGEVRRRWWQWRR